MRKIEFHVHGSCLIRGNNQWRVEIYVDRNSLAPYASAGPLNLNLRRRDGRSSSARKTGFGISGHNQSDVARICTDRQNCTCICAGRNGKRS